MQTEWERVGVQDHIVLLRRGEQHAYMGNTRIAHPWTTELQRRAAFCLALGPSLGMPDGIELMEPGRYGWLRLKRGQKVAVVLSNSWLSLLSALKELHQ